MLQLWYKASQYRPSHPGHATAIAVGVVDQLQFQVSDSLLDPAGVEFAGTLRDFVRGDLARKYPELMADVKVSHRYDTNACCKAPMQIFNYIPQGTIHCGKYVKACHDLVRTCIAATSAKQRL